MAHHRASETLSDAAHILRARARALATPPELAQATAMLDVLEIRLGQERYALEIAHVREVCLSASLTPLPSLPSFMHGIVHVRGRILPVVDLGALLERPRAAATRSQHVIVIGGRDLELGLLAEAAEGVRAIPADSLQPALPTLTGARAEYLRGITPERLVVLDAARLLADPRLIVHQDADLRTDDRRG